MHRLIRFDVQLALDFYPTRLPPLKAESYNTGVR
jgi:hypothetical protein